MLLKISSLRASSALPSVVLIPDLPVNSAISSTTIRSLGISSVQILSTQFLLTGIQCSLSKQISNSGDDTETFFLAEVPLS